MCFPLPALIYGCSHSRLHVNLCVESFELCDELVLITQLTPQLCPQPLGERHWSERNDFTSLWSQQFKTAACPRTRAQPRTSHNYPGGDENAERTGNLAAEIHRTLNPTSYRLLHVALRQESNGGLVCRCKLKRNRRGKKASFDLLFVFPLKWPKLLPCGAVIMLWLAPLCMGAQSVDDRPLIGCRFWALTCY